MAAILPARVLSQDNVGPEIYLLRLAAGEIAAAARPGQFVMLRVASGLEPLLARPFSVHGVAGEELLILYQVRGKGTALLAQARAGDGLRMWGPLGRGFALDCESPVLVAGGMGIAPLAFGAERLSESVDQVRLLYGLPAAEGTEELRLRFATRLGPRKVTLSFSTEDGSLGQPGLVTDLLSASLSQSAKPDAVLACGPLPMLKVVANMCAGQGVPCQVSLEAPMACGVGACLGCVLPAAGGGYLRVCQEGPVLPAKQVDWGRL